MGGRGCALCAYVRSLWAALCLVALYPAPDVVLLDQVAAPIPLLRLLRPAVAVLFYCHFPDQLLAQRGARRSLRAAYRAPLDWAEEAATGAATRVVVNSAFTAAVFAATFATLHARGLRPEVLYPAVALPPAPPPPPGRAALVALRAAGAPHMDAGAGRLLLSINRFERKKGLPLALHAFAQLRHRPGFGDVRLVMAGGYDARLKENADVLSELRAAAAAAGLAADPPAVLFAPSCSGAAKAALLGAASVVLYTPQNEHFGIVPLEAGAAARPVVACASGGPMESLLHGETALLCQPSAAAFADAAAQLLDDPAAAVAMGAAARARCEAMFSRSAFGCKLEEICLQLCGQNPTAAAGDGGTAAAPQQRQGMQKKCK